MKICSLLPSATEILFALGLGDQVVAVSHECDYPDEARTKPRAMTSAVKQDALSSEAIDRLVRDTLRRGESLYRIDTALLERLRPDLIITQELCQVCAIDTATVRRGLEAFSYRPRVVSLHPHTLAEALEDIRRLGQHTERAEAAQRLVQTLQQRLKSLQHALRGIAARPRVACIEWLAPVMVAGHWVPEMVEAAGGTDVLGHAGEPSRTVEWSEVITTAPEALIIMPCGLPIARAQQECDLLQKLPGWEALPAVMRDRVYLVESPAYFSSSGPRLLDGVEILAGLLHPDRCAHLVPARAAFQVHSQ